MIILKTITKLINMNDKKFQIKEYLIHKDRKFNSISKIGKLPGGSSNETWVINYFDNNKEEKIILRRHHSGIKDKSNIYPPLSLSIEASVMEIAYNNNIPVPKIIYKLNNKSILGEGFFMEFVEGMSLGNKIVQNTQIHELNPSLASQAGNILAKIHSIPFSQIKNLNTSMANDELIKYREVYKDFSLSIPVFNMAFKWLEENLPNKDNEKCLLHGDFRNGNILVSPKKGITSVLDWELLHIGDMHEDLAWMCVNSWRFGKIKLPVGGFGKRIDFYKSYQKISGKTLNKDSLKFWEVMGSLKWGIMCLKMYNIYNSGYDRSVDRASIGRRVSETEIDLLRLIAREQDND